MLNWISSQEVQELIYSRSRVIREGYRTFFNQQSAVKKTEDFFLDTSGEALSATRNIPDFRAVAYGVSLCMIGKELTCAYPTQLLAVRRVPAEPSTVSRTVFFCPDYDFAVSPLFFSGLPTTFLDSIAACLEDIRVSLQGVSGGPGTCCANTLDVFPRVSLKFIRDTRSEFLGYSYRISRRWS